MIETLRLKSFVIFFQTIISFVLIKIPKHHTSFKKVFSIICINCNTEHEKIFKEVDAVEILKILGFIKNR